MQVVADVNVQSWVAEHGGELYVRAHHHRCCSGAGLVTLDTSTERPADVTDYEAVGGAPFPLFVRPDHGTLPDQLVVELRGLRRRPVAYWNGCQFKV